VNKKFPAVCVHLLAKFVPWSTRKSNVVVIVEEVMGGGNGDLTILPNSVNFLHCQMLLLL